MSVEYTYLVSDTSDGTVNPSLLQYEIVNSSISSVINHINTDVTNINIGMNDVLSSADEITLTSVVAAHTASVVIFNNESIVSLVDEIQTSSTNWEAVVSLTFFIIDVISVEIKWSCEVSNSRRGEESNVRIMLDSNESDVISEGSLAGGVDAYIPCSGLEHRTVAAGSHVVEIQFRKATPGGTAKIRRGRLNLTRVN